MEKENKAGDQEDLSPKLIGLSKFLCRIAGADLNILAKCPHEISKTARIGAIIISTALLATVSMFFAIQTVSRSVIMGIIAGLLWGMVIFILDSFIIASYKKNDKKREEIKIALPRLFLAVVLGFSISIPMELKIFSNEITEELKLLRQQKEVESQGIANVIFTKQIEPLVNRRTLLQQSLNELIEPIKQINRTIQENNSLYANEMAGTGLTKKYGKGPIAKELERQIIALEVQRNGMIRRDSAKIEKYKQEIAEIDNSIASISKPTPEKIGELYGITAQLDALKILMGKNIYVAFAYWIFFLLIIGIETAPIFVKFFSAKGCYDEMLAAKEYIISIEQQKKKSDLHQTINAEIEAYRSISKRKKISEDALNEKVMGHIEKAQAEIAEKAIQLWKIKQLKKMTSNLDLFIKSNYTQDQPQ